jgi:serine protease Do
MPSIVSALAAKAAAALVVLEFEESYGVGFVVGNEGKIVTCLHVVADEPMIRAHFADGRSAQVRKVLATDVRRDLAVLQADLPALEGLEPATQRLVDDGTPLVAYGMVENATRTRWFEGKVGTTQVLGGALTVYQLDGELPPDGSGGPLINASGQVFAVATVAETSSGRVMLGVPWRYVEPLLKQGSVRNLGALKIKPRKAVKRDVPQHPLALLADSSAAGLEDVMSEISGAIQQGAPAYNAGDADACFKVYVEAAQRLMQRRVDCPGVRKALTDGMTKAQGLEDSESRAWAMRDTFDGLLAVIERWFKAHAGASIPKDGTKFLN